MKMEKLKESRRWLSWLPKALLATLLAGALAFVGCKSGSDDDDDDDSDNDIRAESISVTATKDILSIAETATDEDKTVLLTVTYNPETATIKPAVEWSSSNNDIATVEKKSDTTALVTAITEGTVTITATAEGLDRAEYKITVQKDPIVYVTSVTITPDTVTGLTVGDEPVTLTATVLPDNATNKAVTWAPNMEGIVSFEYDDDPLHTTAKVTALKVGTVKITATAGGKDSNEVEITVEKNPTVTDTPITPNTSFPVDVYQQNYSDAVSLDWGAYVNKYNSTDRGEVTISEDGYVVLTGTGAANNGSTKGVFFATHEGNYNKMPIPDGKDYELVFDFASVYCGNGSTDPYKLYISNANGGALNTDNNPQGGTLNEANVLLSLVQTAGNAATWKVNDTKEVTIEQYGVADTDSASPAGAKVSTETWHRFFVTREETNTTLTIFKLSDDGSTEQIFKETFESDVGGLGEIQFVAKIAEGRQIAYFDNILVRIKEDFPIINTANISASVATLAANSDEESDSLPNSVTLTADVEAVYASGTGTVPFTYAWTLGSDEDVYATLTGSGATATLTGKNDTIDDKRVNVTLTVTAGEGDSTVTKTTTKVITVKAKQSLLSDITISKSETQIEAGKSESLSVTGGELSAGTTGTVTYEWTTSDETKVLFATDNDRTPTVTGKTANIYGKATSEAPVTVTVTASVGSIKKTATVNVTVTESTAELKEITLSSSSGSVASGGRSIKFTATANEGVVPDTWEVTVNPTGAVTATGDEQADSCIITVKSGSETHDSVTITVTAKKDKNTASKDFTLTVREPVVEQVFKQDFTNATLAEVVGVQDSSQCTSEITSAGVWRHYYVASKNSGARVAWSTEDLTEYTANISYTMEFDAALTQMSAQKDFFLVSTTVKKDGNNMDRSSSNPYLLYMTAAGSDSWNILGGNQGQSTLATVTLEPGTFYHYTLKVVMEEDSPVVTLSITTNSGTAVEGADNLALDVFGTSYAAKSFCLGVGIGTGAEQSLDNIVITVEK